MKTGKTIHLKNLKKSKCYYGTVNSKELKSIYIVIQTWIEPTEHIDNWNRISLNLSRQIKHTLLEVTNYDIFDTQSIVDLDLRSRGIHYGKRSFLNLEITLFLKSPIEFKSNELKDCVRKMSEAIYYDDLMNSKYFTIHLTKNDKKTNKTE
jgi:hypothetical protein